MKLRECPFCGGKAVLRSYVDHGGKKSWTVRCENMCIVTCGRKDEKGKWRPTLRKEAVDTWNRRVSDDLMERMEDDGK